EQADNAAAQLGAAGGRLDDAAEDLEQRRFAGAVAADQADHLAGLDLEADVLQGPVRAALRVGRGAARHPAAQAPPRGGHGVGEGLAQGAIAARLAGADPEALRQTFDANHRYHDVTLGLDSAPRKLGAATRPVRAGASRAIISRPAPISVM